MRCFSCCPCCKNLVRKYKAEEDTKITGSGVTAKTAMTSGGSSTSVAGGNLIASLDPHKLLMFSGHCSL